MSDLANAVGFESFRGANVQYGTLGRLVAERCGVDPRVKIQMLVRFVRPETLANREWLLVLRPEVCRALEQLGWVEAEPNVLTIRGGAGGAAGRMSGEYQLLLSEKTALEQMIAETPEEDVLDRRSLTGRLNTILEAIAHAEPFERDPTNVLDDEDPTPTRSAS